MFIFASRVVSRNPGSRWNSARHEEHSPVQGKKARSDGREPLDSGLREAEEGKSERPPLSLKATVIETACKFGSVDSREAQSAYSNKRIVRDSSSSRGLRQAYGKSPSVRIHNRLKPLNGVRLRKPRDITGKAGIAPH